MNVPVIVGASNAVNLTDGLDGLASGVVAIAGASLWIAARLHADFYVMFISALKRSAR
jgi:phospho-N-acetylmuramoyl-pentapeptide-transferase